MQLREMLKLQHVLSPVISMNAPKVTNAVDVFSDVLMKKNSTTTTNELGALQKNPQPVRADLEPSTDKKPKFSLEIKRNEMPDSSAIRTQETERNNDGLKTEKATNNVQKTKSVTGEEAKKSVETEETLTDELKEKLAKKLNLSEEEITQLLGQLNIDFNDLEALLSGQGDVAGLINQLASILETLEIDEALLQPVDKKVGSELISQLQKLIEQMEKRATQSSENPETSEGKPFEASIVQALTKIIAELESMDADAKISPTEVKTALIEAVTQMQSVKTETVETQAKPVNSTPVLEVNSKLSEASNTDAKQSGSEKGGSDQTQQTQVVQTSVQGDANQETLVKTETVKSNQEAIGLHQIIMKQGNSVAAPNVQQAGSLKQEVFTQILDAIKGHMKLSDHGTSLLVKLQPEQLGNVELKLNIQKGIVLAEIKVENTMVKAAIESNLDDLRQSLSQKGYTVDQIQVNVDSGKKEQQTFEFNQNQNQSSRSNQQKVDNEEFATIDNKDQILGTGYQLDLYDESIINYYG